MHKVIIHIQCTWIRIHAAYNACADLVLIFIPEPFGFYLFCCISYTSICTNLYFSPTQCIYMYICVQTILWKFLSCFLYIQAWQIKFYLDGVSPERSIILSFSYKPVYLSPDTKYHMLTKHMSLIHMADILFQLRQLTVLQFHTNWWQHLSYLNAFQIILHPDPTQTDVKLWILIKSCAGTKSVNNYYDFNLSFLPFHFIAKRFQ